MHIRSEGSPIVISTAYYVDRIAAWICFTGPIPYHQWNVCSGDVGCRKMTIKCPLAALPTCINGRYDGGGSREGGGEGKMGPPIPPCPRVGYSACLFDVAAAVGHGVGGRGRIGLLKECFCH